jgi:hypothetical protein
LITTGRSGVERMHAVCDCLVATAPRTSPQKTCVDLPRLDEDLRQHLRMAADLVLDKSYLQGASLAEIHALARDYPGCLIL